MKPDDAFNALQKQELLHKFVEIGKVLLTWAILKNVDMVHSTKKLHTHSSYISAVGRSESGFSSRRTNETAIIP